MASTTYGSLCRQRGPARHGIVSIYLLQDASLFQPCFQHFCHMLGVLSFPFERDHESIGRRQEGREKEGGCTQQQRCNTYRIDECD